jgi:adenosylhomocysteine nucleosidase
MSQHTIGIMGAMPEEIDGIVKLLQNTTTVRSGMRTYYRGTFHGTPAVVVFSRWGKVAAATTVATLILEFHITELIFVGVAGAISDRLRVGDIVIAHHLYQHDMDARPLLKQFEIPLLNLEYFSVAQPQLDKAGKAVAHLLENNHLHQVVTEAELLQFDITQPSFYIGDIASGDKFFSANSDKQALQSAIPSILCVEMEGAAVAQVCFEYKVPFTVIRTISDAADELSSFDFPAFVQSVASKYSVEIVRNLLIADSLA